MVGVLRSLGLLLLLLLVGGCKKPPSVVGVWNGSLLGIDSTVEFKDNKALSISMKQGQMGAAWTGTYEVDPKTLSLTLSDYKLKNVPDTLAPLGKSLFDPYRNKLYKLGYHFNSDDELAITFNSQVDVLKRKKEDQ